MKKSTTLWLGIIVLFLVSVVYILDQRGPANEVAQTRSRVFDITTEPVSLVGIIRGDERIEVVRKDGDWFLQQPIRARASRLFLQRMVATAERLRIESRVTPELRDIRRQSLADYGLDSAVGVFYVEAGGRREQLTLGSLAPFGEGVYGLLSDMETIVLLQEEALSLLTPSLADLRDRTLFSGSLRRVTRVDLHRRDAGFLQFIRTGNRWFIQQPVAWPADPAAIEQFLQALYVLQIQRFVWDAPAGTEDGLQSPEFRSQVESASLAPDQAPVRITVWVEGRDTGEEILLGTLDEASSGQMYARRGGVPSVFTVPAVLGDLASQHANQFRDTRVFPQVWDDVLELGLAYGDRRLLLAKNESAGWGIREPIREVARAEAVQKLYRGLAGLRIVGFDPVVVAPGVPPLVVRVATRIPDPEQKPLYLVPMASQDSGDGWAGRFGETGEWLPMNGFGVETELAALLDVAPYRTLQIFAWEPRAVTWVQQTSARGDVVLVRDDSNGAEGWRLADGIAGALDEVVLPRFLNVVRGLQADAVVALDPALLAPYGLHAPAVTLTFRFEDPARLQQTLLLGIGADDGRIYALLQGHGFVYRLHEADAQALMANILVMPEEATLPAERPSPPLADVIPAVPVLSLQDE